ncbi:hypothetical protein CEJ42_11375 [Herbaspirillum robiniae]|uniref:Uncharacterized protein n=1 Tax=Herbaspirillum robiniae TaxID=2014887 RepID=A0A246WSQ1_9BURK|nr:hypothetical protein CEJ42_11375 [Herbaspirillum robiniae]
MLESLGAAIPAFIPCLSLCKIFVESGELVSQSFVLRLQPRRRRIASERRLAVQEGHEQAFSTVDILGNRPGGSLCSQPFLEGRELLRILSDRVDFLYERRLPLLSIGMRIPCAGRMIFPHFSMLVERVLALFEQRKRIAAAPAAHPLHRRRRR